MKKKNSFSKPCRFVWFQGALVTQGEKSGLPLQTEKFGVWSLNQQEKDIGQ